MQKGGKIRKTGKTMKIHRNLKFYSVFVIAASSRQTLTPQRTRAREARAPTIQLSPLRCFAQTLGRAPQKNSPFRCGSHSHCPFSVTAASQVLPLAQFCGSGRCSEVVHRFPDRGCTLPTQLHVTRERFFVEFHENHRKF